MARWPNTQAARLGRSDMPSDLQCRRELEVNRNAEEKTIQHLLQTNTPKLRSALTPTSVDAPPNEILEYTQLNAYTQKLIR